ncbi:MAG: DUF5686 and carboxypeptidase regulatory-like domain-containing protein [Candidatus Kapabacteria bacterium]|nr:DUF5686 and carboxypeptidase regulatory-like domain-containing protein [Candidatus Kapabacteria bacterium]
MLYIALNVLLLAFVMPIQAEDVNGVVVDAQRGAPLAGASVRTLPSKRGAITRADGSFRIALQEEDRFLVVRLVGYRSDTVAIPTAGQRATIRLIEAPTVARATVVTDSISAEEIVRRAIREKENNEAAITTLSMDVYTRFTAMDSMTAFGSDGVRPEVYEKRSTLYYRLKPEKSTVTVINHRRQTKNVHPDQNVLFDASLEDFRFDDVQLGPLTLSGPIGKRALDVYQYRLLRKHEDQGRYIYEVAFSPRGIMQTGFTGILQIVEGTYDLVGVRCAFAEGTSIPPITQMDIHQTYEETADRLWIPQTTTVTAAADVVLLAGLIRQKIHLTIFQEVQGYAVNVPLADSIFEATTYGNTKDSTTMELRPGEAMQRKRDIRVVHPLADVRPDSAFVDVGAARRTPSEDSVWAAADSLPVKKRQKREDDPFAFSLATIQLWQWKGPVVPIIASTAHTELLLGAAFTGLDTMGGGTSVDVSAVMSFNDQYFGSAGISVPVIRTTVDTVRLLGVAYRRLHSIQPEPSAVFGSGYGNVLFGNQRDYFEATGWTAGVGYGGPLLHATIRYRNEVHRILPRIDVLDRPELRPDAGMYHLAELAIAPAIGLSVLEHMSLRRPKAQLSVSALFGQATDAPLFGRVGLVMQGSIPTFRSGYDDIFLAAFVKAGLASPVTPVQYRFYSTPALPFGADRYDLLTIPLNGYSAAGFTSVIVEHSFADLPWRLCGLPLYKGRGLGLSVVYGAAVFGSLDNLYQEAGIRVTQIPGFLIDVIYFNVDLRWSFDSNKGPRNPFGFTIGISSPLFD